MTRIKEQIRCKMKWRNSHTTMSRRCSACGKGGNGTTPKVDGSTLCVQARSGEVVYSRHHKMCTKVSRETCLRATEKAPIKTGWVETDRSQSGKPNVRARWVTKEYKTHARPELYASTPPLLALKVVLSEVATGKRGVKVE